MYQSADHLLHLLETKDEDYWIREGERMALDLFHRAAVSVPAYKDFLWKYGVRDHEKVRTIGDFGQSVPILCKESYLKLYSINELSWEGNIYNGSVITQSSGTKGAPSFWVRFARHHSEIAILHYSLFFRFFQTNEKTTLYIVCFHLGSHIAGMITSYAIEECFHLNMQGSLITPGLNKEDILNSVKQLAPLFEQIVFIGYPPFIKDVISEGTEQGIQWEQIHLHFIFAAESFSEAWRDNFFQLARSSPEFSVALNIYGSADMGFMAHETPFTIQLRNIMKENQLLAEHFGGSAIDPPPIYQYHPWSKYFESLSGELVCTSDGGIPLVRYNIKDRGTVCRYNALHHSIGVSQWQLPLLSVLGRSDYAVTLYGVNIYPEQIKRILLEGGLTEKFTGKFVMKKIFNNKQDQFLEIHLESTMKLPMDGTGEKEIVESIVHYLCRFNFEYGKLYMSLKEKVLPRCILYPIGDVTLSDLKAKYKYILE